MTPCMLYFLQVPCRKGSLYHTAANFQNCHLEREEYARKKAYKDGLASLRDHTGSFLLTLKTLGTEEALRRIARAMDEHLTPLPDDAPCSNTQATEGEDGHCGLPDNFNQMDEG